MAICQIGLHMWIRVNTRLRNRYYKLIRYGKKRNAAARVRELECLSRR